MTAAVSVALCTHNGARFVEDQVRSILAQTAPVAEIVVSDDLSSDETIEIVQRTYHQWFATHHTSRPELRILRNTSTLGVTANFEQAVRACTGDLIALCDQDDVWHPQRMERLVAEFTRRPRLQLVHGDARLVDQSGAPTGESLFSALGVTVGEIERVHAGKAFALLMRRNIVTGATVMIRASLARRAVPFPSAWVHDEWLAVVAAAADALDLIEQPLTDYRQHGGNQIGASSLTGRDRFRRLREPRTERNARLLARAGQLAARAPRFEPAMSAEYLADVNAKLVHERVRSALPVARIRRVPGIWREWRSGRYRTCGLGLQDIARDLVQPV
jgi:glycosyltransferase involved in cell wall biosynthesis